ncbi:phosphonate C-P lyase system protein PhnG [Pantoea allii]|uniref:Phosphonate C-P lyase system protein PhnG n=2 Tax=Erwiniaceae TaxID=1903409 RepID=A0ABS6VHJ0_9GAMM|nr:phosphonate C-P lyase system protein PhnG [Pantoea allii]MBW1214671.1 phosphonate C-P lyase system protein PhnG [Pantoea allii]MBW1258302.1 phosphonate C-P lyase system protein PhnG [Pantoea allii]MBW1267523.1 phosphonate C-P lyase system protein PhnG [Pantoea allii]MBW1289515.1 phosphonate C-P lyase system protein PhnG [Pantoea allii]
MKQQTARQHWLSVLAHSSAAELDAHWQPLNLKPEFTLIRPAEIGLTRLQARMGATGKRFVVGDATVTRAVVRLNDGTLGYSYLLGRDKAHAERCALMDALLQQTETGELLQEKIITPLAASREEQRQLRAREIASSKVDFFTLVRGDN